ncbi:hypothetical protein [Marinilactibacillus kalidii]|uniref:hypothetical protein n=1 Tax=Marinilactibacillus kalidii TaxID=2820274 RepID=UPI001ABE5A46|nr:hypothetical protein [Marinilactibacillus kalidii]
MSYYHGIIFFQTFIGIFIFMRIGYMIILIKRKEISKKWFTLLGLLAPLLFYLFVNWTMPLYKDLPKALRNQTEVVEGKIESVYYPDNTDGFVMNGIEYQRNPWVLKPKVDEQYKLYYLPNSKFVVKHEKILEE